MIRALRLLNLRRLARIRLRTLIAVVAVAAGTSLALSVVIVDSSVSTSINRLSQEVGGGSGLRLAGATATGGLDFRALSAAASTPGVAGLIPVVESVTVVRTQHRHNQTVVALGITCSAATLVGGAGCASNGSSLPANTFFIAPSLQRQLRDSSWLQTDLGIRSMRHAVVLPGLESVNRGDAVVMALSTAQFDFDRPGRVDLAYVIPAPRVSQAALSHRLARAIGPWDGVVASGAPSPLVSEAVGSFAPILGLLALLAAGIAIVLVYNVVSVTLVERRREQAIVASIGAPPSLMIVGPLLEAGVLGAVGGIVGALGGAVLAGPIVSTLSHFSLGLVGIPITERISPSTYLIGLVVGLFIGVVAAVAPVRRAMRMDISAELSGREQRERASGRATLRYALIWSALTIGGTALSWLGDRNGSLQPWQPLAALGGFLISVSFATVAAGAWAPIVLKAFSRPGRGGAVRLALANLVREPGRTGIMAVAIGATVGVAFITTSYNKAIDQDIGTSIAQSSEAHAVVVSTVASGDGAFNVDALVPYSALRALARIPGVTSEDRYVDVLTGTTSGQLTLIESDSRPGLGQAVYAGSANRRDFERGEVLVGANLARRQHLHPGSRLPIDTPSGFVPVTVEGIWNVGDDGGDNVYMNQSLEERLFGDAPPGAVGLEVARGTSPSEVVRLAKAAHLGPYLTYADPTKELHTSENSVSGQLAPFLVLQRALLLVSFISVLSTLLLVGIQRRREFGLMAAVGIAPRQLFSMVVAEGLMVSVVSVVLGPVFGILMLESLLSVTPIVVGFHDTFNPDFFSLLVYGPIAIVVAVGASLWPGWLASRTPILEALTYE
jgi:putative ABC transport system permease protein